MRLSVWIIQQVAEVMDCLVFIGEQDGAWKTLKTNFYLLVLPANCLPWTHFLNQNLHFLESRGNLILLDPMAPWCTGDILRRRCHRRGRRTAHDLGPGGLSPFHLCPPHPRRPPLSSRFTIPDAPWHQTCTLAELCLTGAVTL